MKIMTNCLISLACDIVRNTKDGVRTMTGTVAVTLNNEPPTDVNVADLVAFLAEEGLSPDAKNDQDQTARHYFTNNLKGNVVFMIQVTNGQRHWRILKKVKNVA